MLCPFLHASKDRLSTCWALLHVRMQPNSPGGCRCGSGRRRGRQSNRLRSPQLRPSACQPGAAAPACNSGLACRSRSALECDVQLRVLVRSDIQELKSMAPWPCHAHKSPPSAACRQHRRTLRMLLPADGSNSTTTIVICGAACLNVQALEHWCEASTCLSLGKGRCVGT